MKNKRCTLVIPLAMTLLAMAAPTTRAALPADYKATPIPESITTPPKVESSIGTLEFFDGVPSADTAQKAFDNLDRIRATEAFLNGIPGASLVAMRTGMRKSGVLNESTVGIFETLMDSRSLYLTANTESIYFATWLDLKKGPIVVESPPDVLGVVDDFWFRYVADLGNAGPDRGKGGKFLFLPPDYKGTPPAGYHVYKSPTYGNIFIGRGFTTNGDPKPAADSIK